MTRKRSTQAPTPRRRNYAVFYPPDDRMAEIDELARLERRTRAGMLDVLVDEAITARSAASRPLRPSAGRKTI